MKSAIRPLAIIGISILGFLLIVVGYADTNKLKLTAEEMHTKISEADYLLEKDIPSAQLIDIRSPEEFMLNNVEGTLNIPLSAILDKKYESIFGSEKPKVILAYDPIKAHEAWMLLTQLGYQNLFVKKID